MDFAKTCKGVTLRREGKNTSQIYRSRQLGNSIKHRLLRYRTYLAMSIFSKYRRLLRNMIADFADFKLGG